MSEYSAGIDGRDFNNTIARIVKDIAILQHNNSNHPWEVFYASFPIQYAVRG